MAQNEGDLCLAVGEISQRVFLCVSNKLYYVKKVYHPRERASGLKSLYIYIT